ncbi:MAG: hypothetical protein E6J88_18500 [Deltaproteobacteria bacterium]|nr:MAG: hypothetical protein E6J88_18500 [Deltaproteobacteria bacterium]
MWERVVRAHPPAEDDQRVRFRRHSLAGERPHQPRVAEQSGERSRPLRRLVLNQRHHGPMFSHRSRARNLSPSPGGGCYEERPMTFGKNFRLPLDVRPVRYSAHLAPDLAKGAFEGRMELEVRLEQPRREIHLHAVGLEVGRARARPAARATVSADSESETVTLVFPEDLAPGTHVLDIAWSGKFSPGLRGLYRAGPLAVTQFEAADARRVFPCFDEPLFKARWSIQLVGLPDGARRRRGI